MMRQAEMVEALTPLWLLIKREEDARHTALRRAFEIERTEFKRKLKYMEAQRDKWKADATKLRKQVIMSRTTHKETQ